MPVESQAVRMQTAPAKQIRKRIGPEEFRLEYAKQTPEVVLYNDIVSYLGEYRLQVPQYQYQLIFSQGPDGERLRDMHQGEPMVIKGKRAIADKLRDGKRVDKFVADVMGMEKLEKELLDACDGDTIIYGSPPDAKAGYTYGFMYVGSIEIVSPEEKILHMRAIRLDNNPTIAQYSQAISLITGRAIDYVSANDVVANPQRVAEISDSYIHFVLAGIFGYQLDKKRQQEFSAIIADMSDYIDGFIQLIKSQTSPELLLQAFYALEHCALEKKQQLQGRFFLRRELDTNRGAVGQRVVFQDYAKTHATRPPEVKGSCNTEDELAAATLFIEDPFGNNHLSLAKNYTTSSSGSGESIMKCVKCPFCRQTVDAIVTLTTIECPSCHAKANR